MNRTISIVIIVIFLGVICTLEQILVTTTLDDMKTKSKQIFVILDEYDDISFGEVPILTSKLNEYWTEKENLLCFFINHKEMQEMGIELEKMLTFCALNNIEEYRSSLKLIMYYTNTFHHIMGISLQNLI